MGTYNDCLVVCIQVTHIGAHVLGTFGKRYRKENDWETITEIKKGSKLCFTVCEQFQATVSYFLAPH